MNVFDHAQKWWLHSRCHGDDANILSVRSDFPCQQDSRCVVLPLLLNSDREDFTTCTAITLKFRKLVFMFTDLGSNSILRLFIIISTLNL